MAFNLKLTGKYYIYLEEKKCGGAERENERERERANQPNLTLWRPDSKVHNVILMLWVTP